MSKLSLVVTKETHDVYDYVTGSYIVSSSTFCHSVFLYFVFYFLIYPNIYTFIFHLMVFYRFFTVTSTYSFHVTEESYILPFVSKSVNWAAKEITNGKKIGER